MLEDPEKRMEMGKRAMNLYDKNYAYDKAMEKYYQMFMEKCGITCVKG